MKSGATRERPDYEREEASRKLTKRDADQDRELFVFRVLIIVLLTFIAIAGGFLFHRHGGGR